MDELETRIAIVLANRALMGSRTTYPMLADTVGWYNRTGQGLGRPLAGVLEFCDRNNLPMLTSIVCATGTNSPSSRGIVAMEQVLKRQIDVQAEQKAVFHFDWLKVAALGLEVRVEGPNLRDLYATEVERFQPEQESLFHFSTEACLDACLDTVSDKTLSIVHVYRTLGDAEGGEYCGRLAGITELAPLVSDPRKLALEYSTRKSSYSLPVKRAWRFLKPPLAISTLATNGIAMNAIARGQLGKVSPTEIAEILQHDLVEVPVSGQARHIPPYIPPAPSIHTYMVVCSQMKALKAAGVEAGHRLVKIGVSNDRERRLQELNGNHIAVIFGILFNKYSEGTWASQCKALEVERQAHEWCHRNGKHASGEYFYLREDQLSQAGAIVFNG